MRSPDRRPTLPLSLNWGIGLAATTAVISGIAIYLNSFAVQAFGDATLFTTLKNGVAALILVGLVLANRETRHAAGQLSPRQRLQLILIGLFGGGAAFLLFFNGLALASAPSAAFIHKTLFLWVALLAVPLLGERIGWIQGAALAVLFGSQLLIMPLTGVSWGMGETLIAAATGLWAIEVIVARRLLRDVPSSVAGAGRLAIGMVVLVPAVLVTGGWQAVASLSAVQWLWVCGTGVLLSAYVATWYAALRRAPATVVTAVLVLAAPVTATLTAIGTGVVPLEMPFLGYAVVIIGAAAVMWGTLRVRNAPLGRPVTE